MTHWLSNHDVLRVVQGSVGALTTREVLAEIKRRYPDRSEPSLAVVRDRLRRGSWQSVGPGLDQRHGVGALRTSRTHEGRIWWWEPTCLTCGGQGRFVFVKSGKFWECKACEGRGIRPFTEGEEAMSAGWYITKRQEIEELVRSRLSEPL